MAKTNLPYTVCSACKICAWSANISQYVTKSDLHAKSALGQKFFVHHMQNLTRPKFHCLFFKPIDDFFNPSFGGMLRHAKTYRNLKKSRFCPTMQNLRMACKRQNSETRNLAKNILRGKIQQMNIYLTRESSARVRDHSHF